MFCVAGAGAKEDPQAARAKAVWRIQAEREGPVRVLQWGGIGYSTAKWPHRYAVLYRGHIYVLDKKSSLTPLATQAVYIDCKIAHMPPQHVGGTKNVVAIYPDDLDIAKVAENGQALLLRFSSQEEVYSSMSC